MHGTLSSDQGSLILRASRRYWPQRDPRVVANKAGAGEEAKDQ
jgi:hypothetical protein